jgi:hypothetical protein
LTCLAGLLDSKFWLLDSLSTDVHGFSILYQLTFNMGACFRAASPWSNSSSAVAVANGKPGLSNASSGRISLMLVVLRSGTK